MKQLLNNTTRHLSAEEWQAVMQCEQILTKAFKRKVWQATINPDKNNADDIFGVMFNFDKWEE